MQLILHTPDFEHHLAQDLDLQMLCGRLRLTLPCLCSTTIQHQQSTNMCFPGYKQLSVYTQASLVDVTTALVLQVAEDAICLNACCMFHWATMLVHCSPWIVSHSVMWSSLCWFLFWLCPNSFVVAVVWCACSSFYPWPDWFLERKTLNRCFIILVILIYTVDIFASSRKWAADWSNGYINVILPYFFFQNSTWSQPSDIVIDPGLETNIFAHLPLGQVNCKFYLPSKHFVCPVRQMTSDEGINLWNVPTLWASVNQNPPAPPTHLVVWASQAAVSIEPWLIRHSLLPWFNLATPVSWC